ncbi:MAG: inositol monophosphatase [Clostridia bacterium]|nr:inositol monophosphatase [Clostridia bacterium]
MDLQALLAGIEPIVRRAGAYIRTAVPSSVDEKSNHSDLVTEYDVNTQRMLMSDLAALHPEANFMGEEEHLEADIRTGDCFVIDPIDGTTNFVKGFNRSCISVALLRNGQPAAGVVYNPWNDEYYSALKGQGALLNGTPIRVQNTPLKDSVVGCGTCPYYPDLAQKTLRVCSVILNTALDIRRMGSAALDLCDAAMSRTGAFFELKLSPWDYAAAGLILTEAGGEITDTEGNPVSLSHPSPVVAGNPIARKELEEIIRNTK